jgi:hypothetical protein
VAWSFRLGKLVGTSFDLRLWIHKPALWDDSRTQQVSKVNDDAQYTCEKWVTQSLLFNRMLGKMAKKSNSSQPNLPYFQRASRVALQFLFC